MVDPELCDELYAWESTRSQIIINHFVAIANDIGAILREYQPLRQCLASFECLIIGGSEWIAVIDSMPFGEVCVDALYLRLALAFAVLIYRASLSLSQ